MFMVVPDKVFLAGEEESVAVVGEIDLWPLFDFSCIFTDVLLLGEVVEHPDGFGFPGFQAPGRLFLLDATMLDIEIQLIIFTVRAAHRAETGDPSHSPVRPIGIG
jgi:hypothetical protein